MIKNINMCNGAFSVCVLIAGLFYGHVVLAEASDDREVLYWVAPMDPNYKRDNPGKSPMGMDLIPVYADENATAGSVTISPQVIQNLGVRTTQAERSKIWRGIDTVGYVDYDESKVSHIHLRTEGWIEDLLVRSEGERVKKGEKLFDFYSPELVNAQEEYIQTLRQGNSNLAADSAERLSALGISKNQIAELRKNRRAKQYITVYAPQDGVVSALPVREGMFVTPSMRVMTLADLSSIWLLAEVFERQTAWVKEGQQAEVRVSYLPGTVLDGIVEYIYPSLDPVTRTLKVRLRFDNPEELLKPNMYANVRIFGGAKANVVVIPLEALIRSGREDRVIIAKGDGQFEARKVLTGIESGQWVEIKHGIDEQETIVISGQFLIDSEASIKASLQRMTAPSSVEEKNDEHGTSMQKGDEGDKEITVTGIIKQVNENEKLLTIEHGPVDQLGWSAMTMDFVIAESINLDSLKENDNVSFKLENVNERYIITSIDVTDKAVEPVLGEE